jgi:hypothetical protein
VSQEGIWTRGALAIEKRIAAVSVPFNPGFDDSIAGLAAGNVTGLQVVADGGTVHAVLGSRDGLFYAKGSTDPDATTQVEIQKVSTTPPVGPSIALDGNGTPWIAFYTSTSTSGSVELARRPATDGGGLDRRDRRLRRMPTAVVTARDGVVRRTQIQTAACSSRRTMLRTVGELQHREPGRRKGFRGGHVGWLRGQLLRRSQRQSVRRGRPAPSLGCGLLGYEGSATADGGD